MENDKRAVRGITKSDIDPQGNVVLWDHGPSEPGPLVEKDSDEYKRLEAEDKAWHAKYGDGAVAVTMASGDAQHAMAVEPIRYSLDPDVDEADVEAEVKKLQEQRAKDEQTAKDRADAVQTAIDRKAAIATVQAARRAAALEAKTPQPKGFTPGPAHAEPSLPIAPQPVIPTPVAPQPIINIAPAPIPVAPPEVKA